MVPYRYHLVFLWSQGSKEKRTGEPWSICRQGLSSAPSHARSHLVRWLAAACSCPSTPENVHSLCLCGSGIFISDPGSKFFHSRSRIRNAEKDYTSLSQWVSNTAFCLWKNLVKFQIPVRNTPVPVFSSVRPNRVYWNRTVILHLYSRLPAYEYGTYLISCFQRTLHRYRTCVR